MQQKARGAALLRLEYYYTNEMAKDDSADDVRQQ